MTESKQNGTPIKGAEIAIKTLEKLGVDIVFAYPGGAAIEFHQALKDSPIRVILPRNEQGGAFAADGYARATGKTGVCMATSGPGATNLLTGIADAYMDSIPMVIITGQVAASFIGKNAFQETDIIGMTRPIVKHSYLVLTPEDIVPSIVNAFHLANTGRPGPVLIDIPKNVQQAKIPFVFDPQPTLKTYSIPGRVSRDQIEEIRAAIAKSERPCIYAGGGIIAAGAAKELTEFAEKYDIPVVTTLMGVGAIPEDHPLSLKWLGMHGTYYANYAANESDLLLAFGARFDDRVTGNPKSFAVGAKIIHVDIDDSEINKNKAADLGVVANMADRVAVMYAGKIVEIGTADDVFYSPAHPYTWALLSSMPDLDTKEKLEAIPGTPPNMIYPPKGDAFAERNKYALKQPPMFRISDTHYAATWLLHPEAPKIDPPKSVTERIARMKGRMAEAQAAPEAEQAEKE